MDDSGIDCFPSNRPRPLPGKRYGLDSEEFKGSKISLDKLRAKYPSQVQGDID